MAHRMGREVTALARKERSPSPSPIAFFTEEQKQVIKDTVAQDATDAELELFLATCQRTGLDPFAKQICFVKRFNSSLNKKVGITQVTIDGYRWVAQRTGQYLGQSGPYWCGEDGIWKEEWLLDTPPVAAKVYAHRAGFSEPMKGFCRFNAYAVKYQGALQGLWKTMGDNQIAKCAEAQALRKAFPELSGTYIQEEMEQMDRVGDGEPVMQAEVVTGKDGSKRYALEGDWEERNKAAQAKVAIEWDELCEKFKRMIDQWPNAESAYKWAHMNGYVYATMPRNPQARVWTAAKNRFKELGIDAGEWHRAVREAPGPVEGGEQELSEAEKELEEVRAQKPTGAQAVVAVSGDLPGAEKVDELIQREYPHLFNAPEGPTESEAAEEIAQDPETGEVFLLDDEFGFSQRENIRRCILRDLPDDFIVWALKKVDDKVESGRRARAKCRAVKAWREKTDAETKDRIMKGQWRKLPMRSYPPPVRRVLYGDGPFHGQLQAAVDYEKEKKKHG